MFVSCDMSKPFRRTGICKCIVYACLGVRCSIAFSSTAVTTSVYFYVPESNINNLAQLKDQFESYVSQHGPYTFQPFSDRAVFEQQIRTDTNAVLLISSWYYRQLNAIHPVKPVLVGVSRHQSTQNYCLCGRNGIDPGDLRRGDKIASAAGVAFSRTVLKQILSADVHDIAESVRILKVPKDIDALMALEFGVLKYALTSDSGLDDFSRSSPGVYKSLHKEPSRIRWLLPVVAVREPVSESVLALIMLLEKIAVDPAGIRALDMIKLEKFKRLEKAEIGMLHQ